MRTIFITGIGTDIGKTVVSAIVAEALHADYWKPVQTGSGYFTDSAMIKSLISNNKTFIHPERYCFNQPISPHAAAEEEGMKISLSDIELPETDNTLVIEGAGGVFVPLNNKEFMIDIIQKFNAETIVVIQNYLGSINHSLLTIEALMKRNIRILGLAINGPGNKASEDIILNATGLHCLFRIETESGLDKKTVLKYAKKIRLE